MQYHPDPSAAPQLPGLVLLDKEQAAELLATTPRHVERLVEDGRLGFCRVGRFIRFALPDLQQYMADNHVDPRQREL